jgi:UDP-N-acetylglucosamine 2-epimerase (non-hydrolysing)
LRLPQAKYNLDVGSGKHGEQTGKMLAAIEDILIKDRPDIVLVQGDKNTVLAGALAASKLHIKIGHVEAGLRSFDWTMPEETNRIIADHISDYLFAPTETSRKYLLNEGIPEEKIFVTGNTVIDAAYQNLEISKNETDILKELGLKPIRKVSNAC